MTKLKVYIAGHYDDKNRLRDQAARVAGTGSEVLSSWLKETYPATAAKGGLSEGQYLFFAERDLKEVAEADLIVVDTFGESNRGGREVEFGFGLALGKRAFVVGPKRNVFHRLVPHFDTWDDVHAYFKEVGNAGGNDGC